MVELEGGKIAEGAPAWSPVLESGPPPQPLGNHLNDKRHLQVLIQEPGWACLDKQGCGDPGTRLSSDGKKWPFDSSLSCVLFNH